MPIIVDPAAVAPPPVTATTSSDGHISVTLDSTWSGALLSATWASDATPPIKIRFYRDGQLVRSGDPAWAPGGIAVAYDIEAPLGVMSQWTAVPIYDGGTVGASSTAVSGTVPGLTSASWPKTSWLKCLSDPAKSVPVHVETPPSLSRSSASTISKVIGSPFPVGSIDTRAAYTGSITLITYTSSERTALEAALDSGVLLFQTPASVDMPDTYIVPGDVSWEWVGPTSQTVRRWTVAFTQVARPSTSDSGLVIPGRSWDSVVGSYSTWSAVTGSVASWKALLGG